MALSGSRRAPQEQAHFVRQVGKCGLEGFWKVLNRSPFIPAGN